YLASRSPRRIELLRQVGLAPIVVPSGVDETPFPGEPPRDLVLRLAEAKGRAAAERLGARSAPGVLVAADTCVSVEGEILGKPSGAAEAGEMLRRLRGRVHEVWTGVFLLRTDDGRSQSGTESANVRFRNFDDAALLAYVESGEPMDKAGAYGLQGRGALLVESVQGSWSTVVGLPLERLPGWMERLGVPLELLLRGSGG